MWWKGKNMFFLQVEDSFDSAHFLKGYEGKCRNIHGHRWKILIEVEGEELDKQGLNKIAARWPAKAVAQLSFSQ